MKSLDLMSKQAGFATKHLTITTIDYSATNLYGRSVVCLLKVWSQACITDRITWQEPHCSVIFSYSLQPSVSFPHLMVALVHTDLTKEEGTTKPW